MEKQLQELQQNAAAPIGAAVSEKAASENKE